MSHDTRGAKIFVRNSASLYYHRERFTGELPELSQLYYVTYTKGICSPRPYHQHLPRDASMFYCVLASFSACCMAWNLDPVALLIEADADARVTVDDLIAIREHARWEKAAIPGTWDERAIRTLCDALEALDCYGLPPLRFAADHHALSVRHSRIARPSMKRLDCGNRVLDSGVIHGERPWPHRSMSLRDHRERGAYRVFR
jgi:hypothetical protein